MDTIKTHMNEGGRIVIPARYRRALKLKPGDEVILALKEGEVRLLPPAQAVKRAQALVRRFVPKGRMLSNELIKERRREALQEESQRRRSGNKA